MNSLTGQSYQVNFAGLILKRSFLVFIVVLFFCDIAIYLSLSVSPRLEPQYWIGLLVLLGLILAWTSPRTRWEVFRTPVFFWCVFFFALTVIFFFAVPTSHVEQLKERFRDVVLLTAFLGVFLMLRDFLGFTRKLLAVAVVVGVVVNVISLLHVKFLPLSAAYANRAVGFYPNPNESAVALIFGMTLSIGLLPRRWRAPFAILVLAGILATFSREAVLAWLLVIGCLCWFKVVGWKAMLAYVGGLLVCAAIVGFVLSMTHAAHSPAVGLYRDQLKRFDIFWGRASHDYSSMERWQVLKLGWVSFLAHPWIGNGIGFTYHWGMPISTHNMYLLYMDDYGVIGLFLYPLLIWCMARKAIGATRKLAWTMAILLLFWGLFDHNIVQNYYSLFAIALTAALVKISRDESAKESKAVLASAAADSG